MSPDLKIAKAYVLPLGGKDAEETINTLKEYSFLIRKIFITESGYEIFYQNYFLEKMSLLSMRKK